MSPDDIASQFIDFGQPARNPVNPMWKYGGENARIRVIRPVRMAAQNDPKGAYLFPSILSKNEAEQTLSPFYLGPCRLYGNFTAKKMENAWQYAKVYPQHVGSDGNPNQEYFRRARNGWSSPNGKRDPLGKERRGTELYHWWDGRRLNEIQARKRIYVPLYAEQVVQEPYFKHVKDIWEKHIKPEPERILYLMDFDAYKDGYTTLSDVLNNPAKSMGHGFVLAMLLTNDAALRECELRQSQ